jgi:TonB dependent receptor
MRKIASHFLACLLTVGLEGSHCPAGAHAVAVQEQHDLADLLCLLPRMRDSFPALGADTIDRLQFGGSVLDHGQNVGSEPPDQLLRENRPDAFHQAAAEVSLDSLGGSGRHGLHHRRFELQPMLLVPDPPALRTQPFPCCHRRKRPDDRRLLPLPACFHPQDTEAAFVVVEGNAREEEEMTGKAIEDDLAPSEFNKRMEKAAEDDLLAILLGDAPVPAGQTVRGRCHNFPSFFPDELSYFREGLSALDGSVDLQAEFDPERQLVTVTVNDELRRTFRALPAEALPEDGRLHFTTSRDRVKRAIKDSRAEESNWPKVHLLWDLHPVMEWLNFKLMVNFGRKQAPALRLPGALAQGDSLFLIQGEIPNRKGQPVVHEWFAIHFEGQRNVGVLRLEDFLKRTQMGTRAYPNPMQTLTAFPTTLDWSSAGQPFTTLGGSDYFYGYPLGTALTRCEINDDFLKTWGKHKFGFGGEFLRDYLRHSQYTQNAVGDLVPQTIDAFYSGGVDPASPKSDSTRLSQSFPTQRAELFLNYTLAGYGQDEWHIKSNLTLALALRVEHESNPVCAHDCFAELSGPFESISHDPAQPYNQAISNRKQAFLHTDPVSWTPRFSFAWQPLGVSHNTVVRGGLGLFYELFSGGFGPVFSSNPPLVNRVTVFGGYNLSPEETDSLFQVAAASNAAFVKGFAAGENLIQIEASDPEFFPPILPFRIVRPAQPSIRSGAWKCSRRLVPALR